MQLQRATDLAHDLIRERVRPGDTVVDATAGNGHDTLFLAELVGPEGKVIAFDIQPEAIEATRNLLEAAGLADRVELKREGHESIGDLAGPFRAVMFNLGYLPGGDKTVITRPESTIAAMRDSLERLESGGMLTAVVYSGHPGGAEEAEALLDFCGGLDQNSFAVIRYGFLNQVNSPPFLVAIEKRSDAVGLSA